MAVANPEVEFHMNGFLDQCTEMLNNHYKVYQDAGKYHRSVWFFVSKEDGLIWKAASWKAPARNFARGNILDDAAKDVIGVYGL